MSEDACHVLDPDGDVLLTLRNPNAPFAVWDESEEPSVDGPSTLKTDSYSLFDKFMSPDIPDQLTEKDDAFWMAISTKMNMTANGKSKLNGQEKQKRGEERVEMVIKERPLEQRRSRGGFAALSEAGIAQHTQIMPPHPIVDEEQVEMSSSPDSGASASKQWLADQKTGSQNTLAKTQEVTFLLSSRHLSLASSYFKTQLNGPWREASVQQSDGRYHLDASDWDVNALLLLMQIIHGKTKDIPNCIDLETLAKVAVLIDYYKCHETTGFFSILWVKSLKSELPSDLNRELILWLMISVVFLQNDVFESVTKTAVQKSDGPIPMLGLPIPQSVLSAIDWRRQDAINSISTALINLLKSLCQESERCSFDCSAVLLGSLIKNMCDSELLNPTAQEPYLGYQLAAVEKSVQEFKSPSGRLASRNSSYGYHDYYHSNNRHCSCRLPDIIKHRLYPGLDRSKEGFSLQDLQLEL